MPTQLKERNTNGKTADKQRHLRTNIVSDKVRDKVAGALQPVLYNLIGFGMVTKQAHWNVVGPLFRPMHLHLDEIYEFVEGAVDEIAERIVALGNSPNGQPNEVSQNNEIPQIPLGFQKDHDVARLMTDRIKDLIDSTRKQMDSIEDDEPVTADMLHQIVQKLEMHHWMLRAQLE